MIPLLAASLQITLSSYSPSGSQPSADFVEGGVMSLSMGGAVVSSGNQPSADFSGDRELACEPILRPLTATVGGMWQPAFMLDQDQGLSEGRRS